MRKLEPRRLLFRILEDQDLSPGQMLDVERADVFEDEMLALLRTEEPLLLDWLRNSIEVGGLMQAHTSAILGLLLRNSNEKPLIETMDQIDTLNFRLACTLVTAATMRERPKAGKVIS